MPFKEQAEQMGNPDEAKDGAGENEVCLHRCDSCQGADQIAIRLTVKLRGRPEAPDQAPRAHNLFRARGA
jgi:hypothetical protein